jgi:hypothetical protein
MAMKVRRIVPGHNADDRAAATVARQFLPCRSKPSGEPVCLSVLCGLLRER